MIYEELLIQAENEGLIVKEKPLPISDGRIKGYRVAIRKDVPTTMEKACVLAEELGHYYTAAGDITDQKDVRNRKQERLGRLWAYDLQVGLMGLVGAYKNGCHNIFEAAEYLNVPEKFLADTIEAYRQKYGAGTLVNGKYYIRFEPNLNVYEYMQI